MDDAPVTPNLYQGSEAEFERAQFSGSNNSGMQPLGKQVLVLMDQTAKKKLLLPDEYIERMNVGSETGVIIALGASAFARFEDLTPWTDYKPEPGDRIVVEKYAGRQFLGRDGLMYRLMNYGSVAALEIGDVATESKGKAKQKSKG